MEAPSSTDGISKAKPSQKMLSDEQRKSLLYDLEMGAYSTNAELGRRYGISSQRIGQIKKKMKIKVKPKKQGQKQVSNSLRLTLANINGSTAKLCSKLVEDSLTLKGAGKGETSLQFAVKTVQESIKTLIMVRESLINLGVDSEEVTMDYDAMYEHNLAQMTEEERAAYIKSIIEKRGEKKVE